MDELRRNHYLKMMGLTVWQRRGQLLPAEQQRPVDRVPESHASVNQRVADQQRLAEKEVLSTEDTTMPRHDWQSLQQQVRQCQACTLRAGCIQTVFGVGNPQADLLVIGEAPGADEDKQGEPFVGRAGQLLNAMLLAMGFKREAVFVANIIKCRPPDNRDPKPEEASCCEPYLLQQIEFIQPKLILAVGRIAAQNLLKSDIAVGKLRGRIHLFGARKIPLVVTYHPAYLLRSPEQKRKAWQDLQLALSVLGNKS
ncbi:MAG: uracil-DNA glycosylase [Candidatus Thiodiazotropha sp.]|nr:uracil-DNA glycosylase [Candidatus Thiodiazotropha sp.]MCM8882548.1 uracil-DNA glycosylase [Candidatus Thiodiazotropha sp.]MCM8918736.1 uracil-DNA glycosylase [Candidatus Thiodiazotropha sp.]